MEHQICCLISKHDLAGVYKTIYLFLENQNFTQTCRAFKKECACCGCVIPNIGGSVKVLKPEKIYESTSNQTEKPKTPQKSPSETFILESSIHEGISLEEKNILPQQAPVEKTDDSGSVSDASKHKEKCKGERTTVLFDCSCDDDEEVPENHPNLRSPVLSVSGSSKQSKSKENDGASDQEVQENDAKLQGKTPVLSDGTYTDSNGSLNQLPKYEDEGTTVLYKAKDEDSVKKQFVALPEEHQKPLRSSLIELTKYVDEKDIKEDETEVLFESKDKNLDDVPVMDSVSIKDFQSLKKNFVKLQDEHQKLIAVTTELTKALQNNILGQTKNYDHVLDQCKTIYPSLFVPPPEDSQTPTDVESSIEDADKNNYMSDDEKVKTPPINQELPQLEQIELAKPNRKSADVYADKIVNDIVVDALKSPRTQAEEHPSKKPLLQSETEAPQQIQSDSSFKATDASDNNEANSDLKTPPPTRRCEQKKLNIFPLDFEKLKNDLIGDIETNDKIKILQAIRLRITKCKASKRNCILSEYVKNDLLNLTANQKNLPAVYFVIDDATAPGLLEEFSRLVNTFACFTQGRDYLISKKSFLDALLQRKIFDCKPNLTSTTREMLVATLQKLSLRKPTRRLMIKAGVADQVVDFLCQCREQISEYCLEYASALLMNLALEPETRNKLAKRSCLLVNLLKELLNCHECALPYVNGTMYSVLSHKDINKTAKEQNLDTAIMDEIEKTADSHCRKQLEIILNCRFTGSGYELLASDDGELKEEVDLLETEVDEGETLPSPSGVNILEKYRLKTDPRGSNYLCRPVTPAHFKQTRSESRKNDSKKHHSGSSKHRSSPTSPRSYVDESWKSSLYKKSKSLFPPLYHTTISTKRFYKYKVDGPRKLSPCKKRSKSRSGVDSLCYLDAPYCVKTAKEVKECCDYAKRCDYLKHCDYPTRLEYLTQCEYPTRCEYPARYDICNCYAAMKQEIVDDYDFLHSNHDTGVLSDVPEKSSKASMTQSSTQTINKCKSCGERVCECAFESRPKISRTPP